MNLMSALIGLSIAGVAAPTIAKMSIAPFEAQLRAKNLGQAESSAVVFAATYEGGTAEPPPSKPPCTAAPMEDTKNAFNVTCTAGDGKYVQSVQRAFRLAVPDTDLEETGTAQRQFEFETPTRYSGHQCPVYDAWGTKGYNDMYYEALNGACTPSKAFSQTAYQLSNPDEWLYDINNWNSWGDHPDY